MSLYYDLGLVHSPTYCYAITYINDLAGSEGETAGHAVQVLWLLGLRAEDRQVRGGQGAVQGTHALPRPRDAQHLPGVPHLRVHGQQIDGRHSVMSTHTIETKQVIVAPQGCENYIHLHKSSQFYCCLQHLPHFVKYS